MRSKEFVKKSRAIANFSETILASRSMRADSFLQTVGQFRIFLSEMPKF